MGDSVKEFLAKRRVELDDIPSVKHPGGKSYRFAAPAWKQTLALKALLVYGAETDVLRAKAEADAQGIEDPAEREAAIVAAIQPTAAERSAELTRIVADLTGDAVEDPSAIEGRDEERLYRVVMGSTYDELVADGVDSDAMEAVLQLLIRKYGTGQDIAAQIAASVEGKAPTQPNRQTRRGAGQRAGSKSSPASGARTAQTRKRAAAASSAASKTPAKAKKTA